MPESSPAIPCQLYPERDCSSTCPINKTSLFALKMSAVATNSTLEEIIDTVRNQTSHQLAEREEFNIAMLGRQGARRLNKSCEFYTEDNVTHI